MNQMSHFLKKNNEQETIIGIILTITGFPINLLLNTKS